MFLLWKQMGSHILLNLELDDMKMLAFLAGELSNAAYYFSTFTNVNKEESNDVIKSFGVDWKPFDYSKRLKDAKLVDIKIYI